MGVPLQNGAPRFPRTLPWAVPWVSFRHLTSASLLQLLGPYLKQMCVPFAAFETAAKYLSALGQESFPVSGFASDGSTVTLWVEPKPGSFSLAEWQTLVDQAPVGSASLVVLQDDTTVIAAGIRLRMDVESPANSAGAGRSQGTGNPSPRSRRTRQAERVRRIEWRDISAENDQAANSEPSRPWNEAG